MIAESIKKWHMIAEITKAILMFIGYPVWFYVTIWQIFNMDDVCRSGWQIVNYINFLMLEFYTVTPTIIISLLLIIAICCLPCIIKALKEQRQAQDN